MANKKKGARGKSVSIDLAIWMGAEGYIHMRLRRGNQVEVTTVYKDPKNKRGHPNLYAKLERLLHG